MKVFGYLVLLLVLTQPSFALNDNKFRKAVDIFGQMDGKICWKSTYGRGVGTVPTSCGDRQYDAGLCYHFCRDGFHGVGPMCWQKCPAGWHNHPATCYKNIINWHFKSSYGRGVGIIPKDCGHKQYNAGLCYPHCKNEYYGVGPLCWKSCGGETPTECGAACTTNPATCAKKIINMVQSVVTMIKEVVNIVATAGGSAALSTGIKATLKVGLKIAKSFIKKNLTKKSFLKFMKKKGANMGTSLAESTLEAIFDNADKPLDKALNILENFDPIGLVDVIRAFNHDIC